jgi:hypothetical protein
LDRPQRLVLVGAFAAVRAGFLVGSNTIVISGGGRGLPMREELLKRDAPTSTENALAERG